jgi:hypothetical protein
MASDLLSLADASALLGVSAERVRQLVVAGDLPGVRFGNAWAVPLSSVEARGVASNRRGRPLSSLRAWEAIADGDVDLSNVSRYRNRGQVHRYEMSAADLAFVAAQEQALVSGVAAAIGFGELLQAEGVKRNLYVSAALHAQFGSLVAAVPDQLGEVVVRVVGDDEWGFVASIAEDGDDPEVRFAARGAVALDLMGSGDPRHWVAGEQLVASRG